MIPILASFGFANANLFWLKHKHQIEGLKIDPAKKTVSISRLLYLSPWKTIIAMGSKSVKARPSTHGQFSPAM